MDKWTALVLVMIFLGFSTCSSIEIMEDNKTERLEKQLEYDKCYKGSKG